MSRMNGDDGDGDTDGNASNDVDKRDMRVTMMRFYTGAIGDVDLVDDDDDDGNDDNDGDDDDI